MKLNDGTFSSQDEVEIIAERICRIIDRKWRIMEVCGGQTRSIVKYNVEALLPPQIELVHGPGCPVCVTPSVVIDDAVSLVKNRGVTLLTFGDMMRVPDSGGKPLSDYRAEGNSVKIIYSPLDALDFAAADTGREFVILAVGFETTAPLYAFAITEARKRKIRNLSFLSSLYTVPAAIGAIASDSESRIDGILAAGHVCSITGEREYEILSRKINKPVVITGFEPADIMLGIYVCLKLLQCGMATSKNAYRRAVAKEGNIKARQIMYEVFESCDSVWHGIGLIPESGLRLKKEYEQFDAAKRFSLKTAKMDDKNRFICPAGEIMQGKMQAGQCKYFGKQCTPETPLGAAMITAEGVCSILYNYSSVKYGKAAVIR